MKIAIIGAGPAGITAAYCLTKAGFSVDVYEASSSVGGMAKTISIWDCKVDLGPHRFFSTDKKVNSLWLEVVEKDYQMVNRLTRIYYKNSFFDYPLKPMNALTNLGVFEAARCLFSYFAERINPRKETLTFEDWVRSRFGKRLFEIFFKTYSEKLWGISCKDLDSDFAAQRIKKFSLPEAIKNAFFKGKSKNHKTLVDEFAYPKKGSGMVYERMADFVSTKGNSVHLNTKVKKVNNEGKIIIGITLENGEIKNYDYVISTMPLTLMVQQLTGVPTSILENCSKLKYRNTILVYLKINHPDLFKDNWLYIHSSEVVSGRISNFRNWVPTLYPANSDFSILALEYWCFDEDSLWQMNEDQLIQQASEDIQKTGLIKNAAISGGHAVKLHRSYPVYSMGYKDILQPVQDYLSSFENLYAIGRYGAFKYNNQDHSIFMGILAAENIINNARHNLWEINTDYDSYQEKSTISETGLS